MSGNLTQIINTFTSILQVAVPIIVALAVLFFFWGLAEMILNAGESEKLKQGRERMIWGLIALFVIISLGGLLSILRVTLFEGWGSSSGGGGSNHSGPGTIVVPRD